MPRTALNTPAAPPAGPYSPGLDTGDLVFLAGQMAPGDTIEEQTDGALDQAQALLAEAGLTLDDVVSCLVHLSDLSLFDRYNAAYEKRFAEPRPVRTTVGAQLLGGGLVEITIIARR